MAPVLGEQPLNLGVELVHGHSRQDVGVDPG
jgi:hypothetical protein